MGKALSVALRRLEACKAEKEPQADEAGVGSQGPLGQSTS